MVGKTGRDGRKAVMYGNSGQQTQFIQPALGQPVVCPQTNLPPAYAQNLSGQVMQLCGQPQLLLNVNAQLAVPQQPYVVTNSGEGHANRARHIASLGGFAALGESP